MRKIWALLFAVLWIVGCSGGGSTPISPETTKSPVNNERPANSGSLDSLPIIDVATFADGTFQATGVLGAYELNIDPANMTADLVSKRLPTALGASWTVSGIGFFTIAPCSTCLILDSIALTAENYLQLHFAISHPFEPGLTTLPPSATNRLDLDIFDLALVIAPIGATPTNYGLMGANAYVGVLADNAGLTTELGNVTGDRAAMPYVLVVDDSVSGGSTFNEFPMGMDSFFDVFFDLNTVTTLAFDMYLTMGYGQSAQGKSQRLTPTYFNPEFNKKQAWKVVVTPPQGSDPPAIGNTWQHNDSTTTFNVKVEVYDWQHGVTSIANPPVNTGDIAEASDVSMVSVEIPGMNTTLPSVSSPTSGTGSPTDPLVFDVLIANENLLGVGEYMGLVKVTDSRVPTTVPPGDGIDFMIDSPDGVNLTNFGIDEYATYKTFVATVVLGCGPITGSITSPSCPLSGVASGSTVDFVVSASSGNGGDPITLYECSIDGGSIWVADNPVGSGIFDDVGPFNNPNCPTPTDYYYDVKFRATDSCSPPNVTEFAECEVNVNVCCGPLVGPGTINSPSCPVDVRNGGQLTFQVGGYTSTNATVTYYVDYSYDGVTFNEEDSSTTGTFAAHTFVNTSGTDRTDTVAFKAKDDCTPPNEEVFTATCAVTVHVDASPVGNVTMAANRTTATNGYPLNSSGPWTLSWTAATNAHAYAIYYDTDPTGPPAGYTDNLTYVGETTSTSYTVPSSHLPSNHYIIGYTYVVRSRSVSGDAGSEAANSQPAHIKVTGFETLSTSQNPGYGNNGEGWGVCSEVTPLPSYYYRQPYISSSYCAHGSRSLYYPTWNYLWRYTPPGDWWLITKEARMDVPSSTVRFLDFSGRSQTWWGTWNSGYAIGTMPYAAVANVSWTATTDFEWAYSASGGSPAFFSYNLQRTFLAAILSGVDTSGNYCWNLNVSSSIRRFGGDVNNGGDSTDNYVAFIVATNATPYDDCNFNFDEFVIMIY